MGRDIAVVTGGVSGIGKAIADGLRAAEFRVAVFDLDADAAVAAAGPDGLGVAVDVADAASVDAGFAAVRAALGAVRVLVNNAGIGGGPAAGLCHETPVEVFDRVQAVNTRGPFLCARAALPDMLAAGYGQIITIASINSLVALPGRCAYTTSKGGALMFAKSLAADYGPHGIRSNAICPGMVRTPLVAARIDAGTWDVPGMIPLGRAGQPEEIAEAVVVLASGRLDYMNGSAWVIDGGWTAL
jgi:NAD(P)-dependent dehydrogenase (short-subunit alcohol dehydrogenase family)